MNEAGFDALNEHLSEVRPIFDSFCLRHGFSHVDRKALGRYPRIRIVKPGEVTLWLDLWMELDGAGRRHEVFHRDLTYELSAGAYADLADGSKHGSRIQKAMRSFHGKPFREVGAVLENELERNLRVIQGWDRRFLEENGETIRLGGNADSAPPNGR